MKNSLWLIIVAGFVTGMGNGSVFTIATQLAIGRGPFPEAGLWGSDAYSPFTFEGFGNWVMIFFGIMFVWILATALKLHSVREGYQKE